MMVDFDFLFFDFFTFQFYIGNFSNDFIIKTNKFYAMKILSKALIKQREEEYHTISERILMAKINFPLIVKLHYCFQDKKNLFFIYQNPK